MPEDPYATPSARKKDVSDRPFPVATYVLGWLAICLVVAEGVNSFVSGRIATGVILICLVPAMIWIMHTRRQREAARRRRG